MTIGTRMLYQLQDSMKWCQFRAIAAHHVTPEQVLAGLAQISGISAYEMCVILCVDGLERLDKLDCLLSSMRDLVNDSECWCIVLSASTIYQPVLWEWRARTRIKFFSILQSYRDQPFKAAMFPRV